MCSEWGTHSACDVMYQQLSPAGSEQAIAGVLIWPQVAAMTNVNHESVSFVSHQEPDGRQSETRPAGGWSGLPTPHRPLVIRGHLLPADLSFSL